MIDRKYIKPTSVTWWASMVPILGGLFIAFDGVHGAVETAKAVSEVFGGASPYVLINAGLAGIGLRGALG